MTRTHLLNIHAPTLGDFHLGQIGIPENRSQIVVASMGNGTREEPQLFDPVVLALLHLAFAQQDAQPLPFEKTGEERGDQARLALDLTRCAARHQPALHPEEPQKTCVSQTW